MKTEIIGLNSRRLPRDWASKSRKGVVDPQAEVYARVVERYAVIFNRPDLRLRFLNNTLAKQVERQQQLKKSLRHFRFLERTGIYNWIFKVRLYCAVLEELRLLNLSSPPRSRRSPYSGVPISAKFFYFAYQARHGFYAMGVLTAGLMLFGLYTFAGWTAERFNGMLASKYERNRPQVRTPSSTEAIAATTSFLPVPAFQPEKVWQVEKKDDFERYSNLAIIKTNYETDSRRRGYYLIPRNSETENNQLRRDIVGIIYHTPASHIKQFTADNNVTIQKGTVGLVEFIKANKSYHYLIDPFGVIYRIVKDEEVAFHAGNSVWGDNENIYVGLNESFIGVCFEAETNAQLTEAQLISGRLLTNILRSKYKIEDANCTTHGLVSINPDNMQIGFHHDWVRNFPFKDMALSDKYKVPPPSILEYGFTYDDKTFEKLGNELWEGAREAEIQFKKRADDQGLDPEEMRRKMRDRYLMQYNKANKLRLQYEVPSRSTLTLQSSVAGSSTTVAKN
ncbi:MAG: N-acetylmuramoyl-L-alanine amidase [Acidobacteria bacterium]|nr:N-acetylmuramoyl-L-alanine amidase [Acidobacteriota bacterium]